MKGRTVFFAIITVILPFILLMSCVILVFTPAFLTYEYKKPDFPPDPYGFTLEQRIDYGTASVYYITETIHRYGDDFLAGLRIDEDTPLYNERELSHMKDVKVVYQASRAVLGVMLIFVILTILLVWKNPDSLGGFLRALRNGAWLTIALIGVVIVLIMTSFDALFDGFHRIFFTEESWLFWESDSLIRLFPEKLWVDGFTLTAALTLIFAGLIIIFMNIVLRKVQIPAKSGN